MSPKEKTPTPQPETENKGKISQLCLVAKTKSRSTRTRYYDEKYFFLGLTDSDLPVCTTDENSLSEGAKESLDIFRSTNLGILSIDTDNLIPFKFNYVGTAIDLKDQGDQKTEDLIVLSITDEDGNKKSVKLGELAILKALLEAKTPWQFIGKPKATELSASSKLMYTLLIPRNGKTLKSDIAILLKPTIPGESNETTYRSLLRQVLGRLLMLDESQPEESRKGYLDVIKQPIKKEGILDFFIDTGSTQNSELDHFTRNITADGLKILDGLGFIEINGEMIENIRNPLPSYNLDEMSLDELLSLAHRMSEAAYRSIELGY